METIREVFQRIQENLDSLNKEISSLKQEIVLLKKEIDNSSHNQLNSYSTQKTPLYVQHTQIPTDNWLFKALNAQKKGISTGNRGVPTDRQTDQQTDRQRESAINKASFLLESLDSLKQEIKIKFKKLTEKELLIFATIYQLEEEGFPVNYKLLSDKLSLTESSIRDYVRRLLFKGIPIEKSKQNNKEIFLSISEELKKIASLSTILHLRDL
jgi:hypothetical protein